MKATTALGLFDRIPTTLRILANDLGNVIEDLEREAYLGPITDRGSINKLKRIQRALNEAAHLVEAKLDILRFVARTIQNL